MLLYWVWFSLLSISNQNKKQLLEELGSPDKIYESAKVADKDLQKAQKVLQQCRDKGLKLIPFSHPAYPARLRDIPDPPMVLYLRGHLPDLNAAPVVAVVGTRNCSALGAETARKISGEIAACGGIVVTGMAFGIDAEAARGAVEAGKSVIGVLACGAEQVNPKGNAAIFDAVLEKGCVLSEYPPETPARKWHYPARNRIISGISLGTLVVEAPEKSGALITAKLAQKQGKDVFVVPGAISEEAVRGSNQLLRQGATAVFSGWDVVSEYGNRYSVTRREFLPEPQKREDFAPSEGKKRVKTEKTEKIIIDKDAQAPYSEPEAAYPGLSEEEKILLAAIPVEGRLVDELTGDTGLKVGAMLTALTMLEIRGLVRRLPGNRVAKQERGK